MGILKQVLMGALVLAGLVGQSAEGQVDISLPTGEDQEGTRGRLAIRASDLGDQGVVAYFAKFVYDPSVLLIEGASAENTLSAGMALAVNAFEPGEVIVAASSATALSGEGVLLFLDVVYISPGQTGLTWVEFNFNDGDPPVQLQDGQVSVTPTPIDGPPPLPPSGIRLQVGLAEVGGRVGEEGLLAIEVEDMSDAGVVAYFARLSYNPAVLQIVGAASENTLSAGANVVVNTEVEGEVVVAVSSTEPLVGAGILLNLAVRYVGRGQSSLEWREFVFNEGDPGVILSPGSVQVDMGSANGIPVVLPAVAAEVGQRLLVDVDVGNLSGQGILAYAFRLDYDPQVVQIIDIVSEGTLSEGMSVVANTQGPDRLQVAASQTEAMSGGGLLLRLEVLLVGGGVSPLQWRLFQFNEGSPVPNLSDGQVDVEGVVTGPFRSDFNRDQIVDYLDYFLFADHYESREGEPGWEGRYDLDSNGVVDQGDFDIFIGDFDQDLTQSD